jgi:hypothetical protein
MKNAVVQLPESEEETNVLLDTVIAAHYLALQLRRLPESAVFRGSEATEFLAAALTEWARLAEDDLVAPQEFFEASPEFGRH